MSDENKFDTDKVIDFHTAKVPHTHARREKKVEEIRQAFANYLDDGTETRQQKRKKQRDKKKKK